MNIRWRWALVLLAMMAAPAWAGVCDQFPYGSKRPDIVREVLDGLPTASTAEALKSVCKAKFLHDAKLRQAIRDIGYSDEMIDGQDVAYTAAKVLQAAIECIKAHPQDAGRC